MMVPPGKICTAAVVVGNFSLPFHKQFPLLVSTGTTCEIPFGEVTWFSGYLVKAD